MTALPLIVFDVNETLLELQIMEPVFERIFGEKTAMRLWFANFIMYSAALTVAGCYVPFTDRLGCDEDAGRYARQQYYGDGPKRAHREVFDDAAAPGGAGSATKCRQRYESCAMRVSGCSP